MSDDKINQMSDDSVIAIPLRNLIAIIFAVAVAVVGYFDVTNRIAMAERELALMDSEVAMNSKFRIGWPLGEFGSLPADAEQDRELLAIRDRMDMMWEEIEENDNWIDEFRPPPEVQEAVEDMKELQIELAYLKMRMQHVEKLMDSSVLNAQ
jgi:hypothetical protein